MQYFTIFALLSLPVWPGVGRAQGPGASNGAESRSFIVCVDPGHPSEASPGARVGKLSERKISWQVAQALLPRLRALGIRFVLTKSELNQLVTNRRRAEIANVANADLLLRIHCDVGKGDGFTLYYPNTSATVDGVTGPPRHVQVASGEAARIMNGALKRSLRRELKSNPIKTDSDTTIGRKQGGALTGSVHSRVPTVLIEMGFLNRRSNARFLSSPRGRERMAEALAGAIVAYKNDHSD